MLPSVSVGITAILLLLCGTVYGSKGGARRDGRTAASLPDFRSVALDILRKLHSTPPPAPWNYPFRGSEIYPCHD